MFVSSDFIYLPGENVGTPMKESYEISLLP